MNKAFTLIEILLYVAFIGLILLGVSAFLLIALRSEAKVQAKLEAMFEASRAVEIITREIKQATSVYAPTSVFNVNPGQLSLASAHMAPSPETSTYVDFFQCGTQLCMKRESQNPAAITSSAVQLQNAIFYLINSAGKPSIQMNFSLAVPNQSTISMQATASIR